MTLTGKRAQKARAQALDLRYELHMNGWNFAHNPSQCHEVYIAIIGTCGGILRFRLETAAIDAERASGTLSLNCTKTNLVEQQPEGTSP